VVEDLTMPRFLAGETALGAADRLGRSSERLGARRRHAPRIGGWGGLRAKAVGTVRRPLDLLGRHRRWRIALLVLVPMLALLGAGWLWLRHSSLVAVERVHVSGVTRGDPESRAIEQALARSAHGMSTLDVKMARLRAAVAAFPVVRSVRAHALFPHGLHVEVVEQLPVAVLEAGGERTAVAADGVALGPALIGASLPTVHAGGAQPAVLPRVGRSVSGATLLQELVVLGAAPRALSGLVTRAYAGTKGLTIVLADRVLAYFGDATRPHAKWFALARVLSDASSAGAIYVDVRVPERAAAGFSSPAARPGVGGEGEETSSASDPTTAAALASGLEAAVAGGLKPGEEGQPAVREPESGGSQSGEAAASGSGREGASSEPEGAESSASDSSSGG
jgi:cell division protein FtsQ